KSFSGDVQFEMTRNAFPFGTCVAADFLMHPNFPEDLKHYEEIVTRYFNCAVEEHRMKWVPMEPKRGEIDDKPSLFVRNWCHDHNIPMRGHCIFWAVDQWVPPWLKDLPPADVEAEMKGRIKHMTQMFAGKITEWDLNNEMLRGDWFAKKLGLPNGA